MFNNITFQNFLINIPRESIKKFLSQKETNGEKKKGFDLTVQFLNFLAELKTEFVLEAAVHNIGDEIKFYFAIPKKSADRAVQKARILWSGVEIKPVYGYEIFNSLGSISGFYLYPKMPFIFSISHQLKEDFSVFPSFLSGFSEVNEVGEGAVIQIIGKPERSSFGKNILKTIKKINRGLDWRIALKDYLNEINRSGGDRLSREEILKNLKFKVLHPIFSVNARIIASAPSQFQADEITGLTTEKLISLRKSFFGLKTVKLSNVKNTTELFSSKKFNDKEKMSLNSKELATIFHFPAD